MSISETPLPGRLDRLVISFLLVLFLFPLARVFYTGSLPSNDLMVYYVAGLKFFTPGELYRQENPEFLCQIFLVRTCLDLDRARLVILQDAGEKCDQNNREQKEGIFVCGHSNKEDDSGQN